jgi:hypothetical protein
MTARTVKKAIMTVTTTELFDRQKKKSSSSILSTRLVLLLPLLLKILLLDRRHVLSVGTLYVMCIKLVVRVSLRCYRDDDEERLSFFCGKADGTVPIIVSKPYIGREGIPRTTT